MEFTGERYLPWVEGAIKYEHLHRYVLATQFVAGKDVLDVACGEGYGSALLSHSAQSVVGVDIDSEVINHANRKYGSNGNLKYLSGSCTAIPLPDHSIDVVVSFETIEHISQHEEMMQDIKRVLKPGGMLIISSPNKLVYSDKPNRQNEFHVRELYHDEFVSLLKSHFKHHQLYGQRLAVGSFVYSLQEAGEIALRVYTGEAESVKKHMTELADTVYYIAICSDDETSIAPPLDSLYVERNDELLNVQTEMLVRKMQEVDALTDFVQSEKSRYEKEKSELEESLAPLQEQVRTLTMQLDSITNSRAWRAVQIIRNLRSRMKLFN